MPASRPPQPTNEDLFRAIRAWVAANYPGEVAETLLIRLRSRSEPISLPIPLPSPSSSDPGDPGEAFNPTPFQIAILDALEGRAMKTDALGAAVGDRARLFRPNGLKELQREGLVANRPGLGYYRPDAPPAELDG